MVVSVSTQSKLSASLPRMLFQGTYERGYDETPDGRKFFMMRSERPPASPELAIILGWFPDLIRRPDTR